MTPTDRFASFRAMVSRAPVQVAIHADDEHDFDATVRCAELGTVRTSSMTVSPLRAQRTWKHIRESDPELCQLWLVRHGQLGFACEGREIVLYDGDLAFLHSSRPFALNVYAGDDLAKVSMIQFPLALLPFELNALDRVMTAPLSGESAVRALVADYLSTLTEHPASYRGADVTRLAAITVDLVAALCAHVLERQFALPAESRRRTQLTQVHDYIRRHLGDPHLSPATIADAQHISVRHLHRLFQDEDKTVAEWIRQLRLERCRRELADRHLSAQSVHSIAARWGFVDKAHFSRLFRAAYGMSPSEYRHVLSTERR